MGAEGWPKVLSTFSGTPGADHGIAWPMAMKPPLAKLHSRAMPGWRSITVTS